MAAKTANIPAMIEFAAERCPMTLAAAVGTVAAVEDAAVGLDVVVTLPGVAPVDVELGEQYVMPSVLVRMVKMPEGMHPAVVVAAAVVVDVDSVDVVVGSEQYVIPSVLVCMVTTPEGMHTAVGEGNETGGGLVLEEVAVLPVHHVMPAVSVMIVNMSVGMQPGGPRAESFLAFNSRWW
jgi:hypothetical protein